VGDSFGFGAMALQGMTKQELEALKLRMEAVAVPKASVHHKAQ